MTRRGFTGASGSRYRSHIGLVTAAVLSIASCTPSQDEKSVTGPPSFAITGTSQYDIVHIATPMTIDGNLSDWTGIAAIPTFADDPANGRGALNNTASVRLAWDSTYLYVAYTVTDTEILAVQTTRDHADIYKDDAVELYIDPQGDGGSAAHMATNDYQFLANVRNALGDFNGNGTGGKNSGFNAANFQAAASIKGTLNAAGTDTSYTVEMRIKWSDMSFTPAPNAVMQIDLGVDDRDTPNTMTEEFDWAGLSTSWNNPLAWKEVHLVTDNTAPAAPTNAKLTVISPTRVDVSWTASASTDVTGYKIYRSTSGTPTYLTTVSGSPFQNTSLTASTNYNYQISAVDAAGNESAKTTLKSARTLGHGLRVGLANLAASPSYFGLGPDGDAVGGIYQAMLTTTSTGTINGMIAKADSIDAVIVANLAGSRNTWTDTGTGTCSGKLVYDASEYETNVRAYQSNATLADAIARRRVVVYLVDEPQIDDFCETVTPTVVNDMGLLVKSIWPGAITMVRAAGETLADGWDGSGALSSSFWTGLDYGWAQYEGPHIPSAGETAAQFYTREKSELAAVNLGMVPGYNILDGGSSTCWDYKNTGSSSGRIAGTFTQGGVLSPADTLACAADTHGNTRWVSSPSLVQSAIDAAYSDPDAPFLIGWTHVYSTFTPAQAKFSALETRSDFVTALTYWITKGATRATFNGWRIAK